MLVSATGALAIAVVATLLAPLAPLEPDETPPLRVIPMAERTRLFASVDPFRRDLGADGAVAPPAGDGGAVVTALALTLFATRGAAGGSGTAIIGNADGTQRLYRQGEDVVPGVRLARIAFDHVELVRGGAREVLYLDQSARAPQAAAVVAGHPVPLPAEAQPVAAAPPAPVSSATNGVKP